MNLFSLATDGVDLDSLPVSRRGLEFDKEPQQFSAPTDYDKLFVDAGEAYGVDPKILKAMAYAESEFDPDVISGKRLSKKGAIGLMQFMPDTAKEYGIDPLNPVQAVFGAAAYMRKSLDKFDGSYGKAVASYNYGASRDEYSHDDWDQRVPSETQGYLRKVFGAVGKFKDGSAEQPAASKEPTQATPLPTGVAPSTAGGGRGSVSPGMVNTKLTRTAVPDMTVGSVAQDIGSGLLQVGPTAVKGVGELVRLATGDRLGQGITDFAERGIQATQDIVGSGRAAAQRQNLAADMADDSVSLGQAIASNKGALSDQILPTLGSMAIPLGAAGVAGKAATVGRAAQGMSKAAMAARVASVQQAAGIGATAAQNAASTFAEMVDNGVSMPDAYKAAGITVPFSLIAGKLTGGGAEGALIKGLSGQSVARGAVELAKAPLREGAQEGGESLGQVAGEVLGAGQDVSLQSGIKRVGTEALLGAVVGGGMGAVQQIAAPRVESQPTTPQAPPVAPAAPVQNGTPPVPTTPAAQGTADAIMELERRLQAAANPTAQPTADAGTTPVAPTGNAGATEGAGGTVAAVADGQPEQAQALSVPENFTATPAATVGTQTSVQAGPGFTGKGIAAEMAALRARSQSAPVTQQAAPVTPQPATQQAEQPRTTKAAQPAKANLDPQGLLSDDERQMLGEFTRLYQTDLKADIRQRLGLTPKEQTTAPTGKKKPSALLSLIVQMGGIKSGLSSDLTGSSAMEGNRRHPGLFRNNGKQLDVLVQSLKERGYLTQADEDSILDNGGTNKLADMIQAELSGERAKLVDNTDGFEAMRDADMRQGMEDKATALGLSQDMVNSMSDARLNGTIKRIEARLGHPIKTDFATRKMSRAEARAEREAILMADRYERARAKYDAELQAFAEADDTIQDAALDVFTDEDGEIVIVRERDADAELAAQTLNGTWSDQNEQATATTRDTGPSQNQGEAGPPVTRGQNQGAEADQGNGTQAGTGGEAEISEYGAQNAGFESAEIARTFEAQKQAIINRIGNLVSANSEKRKTAMQRGRRHTTNSQQMLETLGREFGVPADNSVMDRAVGMALLGDDAMAATAVIDSAIDKAKSETKRLYAPKDGRQAGAGEAGYLTTLFGAAAEAEPAQAAKPTNAIDMKALVPQIRAFSQEMLAKANDWASREYKDNRAQIGLRGDGPTRKESISVSGANESRRLRNVEAYRQQAQDASNLANRIESGRNVSAEVAKAIANAEAGRGPAIGKTLQDRIEGYISNALLGDENYAFGDGTLASVIRKAYEAGGQEALTTYTPEEVTAQQEAADKAERTAKAKKQADDLSAKKEQDRKEIAQRSVAAADTFELGGNAEDNLTGQDGLKFSFAGARAATADRMSLMAAQDRIDAGENAEVVRQETGWFKGVDGRWRFEISDNEAKVDTTLLGNLARGGFEARPIEFVSYRREENGTYTLNLAPANPTRTSDFVSLSGVPESLLPSILPMDAQEAIQRGDGEKDYIGPALDDAKRVRAPFQFEGFNALPLGVVMDHPKLFAAYPALRDIMVQVDSTLGNGATFAEMEYVDGTTGKVIKIGNPRAANVDNVLLHEIQHGIQSIEGFATGGSPNSNQKSYEAQLSNELSGLIASDGRLESAYREFEKNQNAMEQAFEAGQEFDADAVQRSEDSLTALPQGKKVLDLYFSLAGLASEASAGSVMRDRYKRLAGEVEARNTQARQRMTDADRRVTPPSATADVPDSNVIVVMNGREMAMAPMPANAASMEFLRSQLDALGVAHSISESNGVIMVSKIVVPQGQRNTGIGTQAMQAIVDYADATGQHIALTPSADFGGNKNRLTGFYKRFGFKENKGRNRVFSVSESMVRENPNGKTLFSQTPAAPPKATTSAIRQAITKAYGNLLTRLEGKGLVTLTQTEDEAIAAAAQARADKNGGDVEQIKQAMRASVLASQRAWHGTPHRGIEKFSTDKIGTGEGAQAYGWGLYYASRKAIAEHYRKILSGKDTPIWIDAKVNGQPAADAIEGFLDEQEFDKPWKRDDARQTIVSHLGFAISKVTSGKTPASSLSSILKAVKKTADSSPVPGFKASATVAARFFESRNIDLPGVGQLYEVDIPNDSDMLLWDKPLSEQPEPAKVSAKTLRGDIAQDWLGDELERLNADWNELTGQELYKLVQRALVADALLPNAGSAAEQALLDGATDKATSLLLADDGIKGIKYLDGTSRNAGEGSYNYVVFSGEDVQIVDVKYSKDGNLEGFFDPATGKSFLIADNLTAESAPGTLMHEVGIHMAADGKLEPLFNRAARLLKLGKSNPFLQRVQARMDQSGETSAEEAAAYIVTEYENDRANAPASVAQWVKDFIADVRAWLFGKGVLLKADQLTVADIAAVARANAKSMAVGDWRTGDGGRRFSRGTTTGMPENKAPGPQGDAQQGAAQGNAVAVSRQIAQAIQDDDDPYADYGLRVIPPEADVVVQPGDELPPSNQWDDGTDTGEALDGTSAVRIDSDTEDAALKAIRLIGAHGKPGPNGYYYGDQVVLIKGQKSGVGEDVGEILLNDAVVVATWRKPDKGNSEVAPNEQSTPTSQGVDAKSMAVGDSRGDMRNSKAPNVYEWADRESAPVGAWVKADYKLADSQPVYQVREMAIDDLYLPELNERGQLQPEKRRYLDSYTERAKSGEKPPAITVIEMESGRMRVVDGHRRVVAAKAAEQASIRALVSPLVDTADGRVEATTENIKNSKQSTPDKRESQTDSTEIRRSISNRAQQPLFNQTPAHTWEELGESRVDKQLYDWQDDRIDLKRVQESITKAGRQIDDQFDARTAETLLPGRLAKRTEDFMAVEAAPLLKDMAKNNVTMEEVSDYMLARHAPERNAQIAKVNPDPDMQDGGAGTNSQGVRMTTQAANDHIAALTTGKRMVLEMLARRVDAITKGTRDLLVAEGLEKAETIRAWEGAYKHYVPLFRDEAANTPGHPVGSGISVTGSSSKRATGSTKEVTNMLAHVLMQREAAITRAEKNRVGMSLYGMALSHPNKAFWSTVQPKMSTADIVAELQRMGVDPMDGIMGMDAAPTIRTVDDRTGLVVDRPNPMYKKLDNAIVVKVNGEDRVILFNTKNERAMRMAESLKNQHFDQGMWVNAANTVAPVTRFMSAMMTQYNPAFGMVNAVRDIQGALVNLTSTPLNGKQARVLADTPAAVIGIARDIRGDGKRTPWSDLWVQFQEDGGRTGYRDLVVSPYERAANMEKDIKRMQQEGKWTPGNAAHAVLDLLGDFNDSLENGVRLAAYKAALDKGMTRPQAAKLARELTVDFNRKGRKGREMGKLYAFLNASIQGNARNIATVMGAHGGKVLAGGFALGVLQALMLAWAGYEDDEIREFQKARALIIPMGGKQHITIPMALGFHVIPNTSRILTELMLTGGKDWQTKVPEAMFEIANAANPFGGGGDWKTAHGPLTMVMPTAGDWAVDLALNRDFTGNQISRTRYNERNPGSAIARESTLRTPSGQVYQGISKAINDLTGGSDRKAGAVSPTPEELRYIMGVVGGGVYRETEKAINAAVMLVNGDEIKATQVPLGSRFVSEVRDEDVQRSRYYKNTRKLEDLEADLKDAAKDRNSAKMNELRQDKLTNAIGLNNAVQRHITQINKMAKDDIGDKAALAKHDADRAAAMRRLNDEVLKLEKQAQ